MQLDPSLGYWYVAAFALLAALQYQASARRVARLLLSGSARNLKRATALRRIHQKRVTARLRRRFARLAARMPNPSMLKSLRLPSLGAVASFMVAKVPAEAAAVLPSPATAPVAAEPTLAAPPVVAAVTEPDLAVVAEVAEAAGLEASEMTEAETITVTVANDRLPERVRKVVAFAPVLAQPAEASAVTETVQAPATPGPFKSLKDIQAWLPGNSDPDLWHVLAGTMTYDTKEAFRILEWILGRPYCDPATAALALIRVAPYDCMKFATIEECSGLDRDRWTIARLVCERSEAGYYMFADFNLSCMGEDNDQADLLEKLQQRAVELEKNGKSAPWPLPIKLLSRHFDGRNAMSYKYYVEDNAVWLRERRAAA